MTSSRLAGPPGTSGISTCADLTRFTTELQTPRLITPQTLTETTQQPAFPGLDGILPGYGQQKPNDWDSASNYEATRTHTGQESRNSPQTFGHFGRSGTFLWVDPTAQCACITLTDHDFGPWAIHAWPPFTDAILTKHAARS